MKELTMGQDISIGHRVYALSYCAVIVLTVLYGGLAILKQTPLSLPDGIDRFVDISAVVAIVVYFYTMVNKPGFLENLVRKILPRKEFWQRLHLTRRIHP